MYLLKPHFNKTAKVGALTFRRVREEEGFSGCFFQTVEIDFQVVTESLVRARSFRSTVPESAQNRRQKRLWIRNWRDEFEQIEPTGHNRICSRGCDAKKSHSVARAIAAAMHYAATSRHISLSTEN